MTATVPTSGAPAFGVGPRAYAILRRDPLLDPATLRPKDWVEFRTDAYITHVGVIVRLFQRWPDSVLAHPAAMVRVTCRGSVYEWAVPLEDMLRRAPAPTGPTVAATVPLRLAPHLPEPFARGFFEAEVRAFLALPAGLTAAQVRAAAHGLVIVYANLAAADQVATAHLWEHPSLREALARLTTPPAGD